MNLFRSSRAGRTQPAIGWDASAPVVEADQLSIAYGTRSGEVPVVHGVSFSLDRGDTIALVGESGSGKTTTAQSLIGLLAANGRITGGRIRLGGLDVTDWTPDEWRRVRGSHVGLVPQDPHNSLNPVKRIGESLAEVLRIHRAGDAPAIRRRVIELLERVDIPEPEVRARQYPHQLSGGMKQRVLIASAIALRPALIIADEATSALDVTVQKTILDLIDELRAESGTAVLLVTHDLAVAADRATHVVVLKDGSVQEHGESAAVLQTPASEYTRSLVANAPALSTSVRDAEDVRSQLAVAARRPPVVAVENLVVAFSRGGRTEGFRAVDDVSFTVGAGMTHAIVGESGSGKSTTARAVMGFQRPTSGRVTVGTDDIGAQRGAALRAARRHLQMVYQNPFGSLDPRQSVAEIIEEPLRNYGLGSRRERAAKAREALERVSLPASAAAKRPREMSGGQRQRVAIARALVLDPAVVVLDEAVSALDVTVQASILQLLSDIQRESGTSYLFISHDLAVVRQVAQTVTVLQRGCAVESGITEEVFASPQHPYTRALLDAIPGHRALTPSIGLQR
ncbi:dipeptide ABC transporter ATP-binding protein [Microbacterium allomyrinae]|uniref:ABC transporter ATP-binding protein n=1 Tax=Microbacterium allomyrinae TaxID=2830666 RepID=A0A9X1S2M6_9MICO|nr:ABC transporter ATP-binding protein [Microbacterium allomyrinae]MCC2031557.1 ABC transporter ATP-binding protein [Microbacterium allomyrinae]